MSRDQEMVVNKEEEVSAEGAEAEGAEAEAEGAEAEGAGAEAGIEGMRVVQEELAMVKAELQAAQKKVVEAESTVSSLEDRKNEQISRVQHDLETEVKLNEDEQRKTSTLGAEVEKARAEVEKARAEAVQLRDAYAEEEEHRRRINDRFEAEKQALKARILAQEGQVKAIEEILARYMPSVALIPGVSIPPCGPRPVPPPPLSTRIQRVLEARDVAVQQAQMQLRESEEALASEVEDLTTKKEGWHKANQELAILIRQERKERATLQTEVQIRETAKVRELAQWEEAYHRKEKQVDEMQVELNDAQTALARSAGINEQWRDAFTRTQEDSRVKVQELERTKAEMERTLHVMHSNMGAIQTQLWHAVVETSEESVGAGAEGGTVSRVLSFMGWGAGEPRSAEAKAIADYGESALKTWFSELSEAQRKAVEESTQPEDYTPVLVDVFERVAEDGNVMDFFAARGNCFPFVVNVANLCKRLIAAGGDSVRVIEEKKNVLYEAVHRIPKVLAIAADLGPTYCSTELCASKIWLQPPFVCATLKFLAHRSIEAKMKEDVMQGGCFERMRWFINIERPQSEIFKAISTTFARVRRSYGDTRLLSNLIDIVRPKVDQRQADHVVHVVRFLEWISPENMRVLVGLVNAGEIVKNWVIESPDPRCSVVEWVSSLPGHAQQCRQSCTGNCRREVSKLVEQVVLRNFKMADEFARSSDKTMDGLRLVASAQPQLPPCTMGGTGCPPYGGDGSSYVAGAGPSLERAMSVEEFNCYIENLGSRIVSPEALILQGGALVIDSGDGRHPMIEDWRRTLDIKVVIIQSVKDGGCGEEVLRILAQLFQMGEQGGAMILPPVVTDGPSHAVAVVGFPRVTNKQPELPSDADAKVFAEEKEPTYDAKAFAEEKEPTDSGLGRSLMKATYAVNYICKVEEAERKLEMALYFPTPEHRLQAVIGLGELAIYSFAGVTLGGIDVAVVIPVMHVGSMLSGGDTSPEATEQLRASAVTLTACTLAGFGVPGAIFVCMSGMAVSTMLYVDSAIQQRTTWEQAKRSPGFHLDSVIVRGDLEAEMATYDTILRKVAYVLGFIGENDNINVPAEIMLLKTSVSEEGGTALECEGQDPNNNGTCLSTLEGLRVFISGSDGTDGNNGYNIVKAEVM